MNKKQFNFLYKNKTIIIGLSGGPDSIYLLLKLAKIKDKNNLKLIAVHLDHEWREESSLEVKWCEKIASDLKIPFISEKLSNIETHKKYNGSKEQFAREKRREFFKQISEKHPNSLIALAHHADDQIETFFIRLARGASLTGLCGMKKEKDNYIRPLINISKSEILEWLNKNSIKYLTDPTNKSSDFLRNQIRNQIIPELENVDVRFKKNIVSAMKNLQENDKLMDNLANKTINNIKKSEGKFNLESFLNLELIIQQRILIKLLIKNKVNFIPSKAFLSEILRFLNNGKKTEHHIHATYKIRKSKNLFSIIKL